MTALIRKNTLTLHTARAIALAAEEFALHKGLKVVIAVLDDGGSLLYLARMDGAMTGSVNVAQHKARSSVQFQAPTSNFEAGIAGGTTALLALDVLPFGGGIPLMAGGEMVGAIGVSGASAPEDTEIAQAAVQALAEILAS